MNRGIPVPVRLTPKRFRLTLLPGFDAVSYARRTLSCDHGTKQGQLNCCSHFLSHAATCGTDASLSLSLVVFSSRNARQSLWLRCETKEFEHRSALTPITAKKLIDAGFDITVERDPQRIFDDAEFEK